MDYVIQTEMVALDRLIADGSSPRQTVEPLEGVLELALSLREIGQRAPIQAMRTSNGDYLVIDGLRRLEAARLIGLTSLRTEVYEPLERAEFMRVRFTLNNFRNPRGRMGPLTERTQHDFRKKIAEQFGRAIAAPSNVQ